MAIDAGEQLPRSAVEVIASPLGARREIENLSASDGEVALPSEFAELPRELKAMLTHAAQRISVLVGHAPIYGRESGPQRCGRRFLRLAPESERVF